MFLLFINDLINLFIGAVSIKRFADDIKVYLEITYNSALPMHEVLTTLLIGTILFWSSNYISMVSWPSVVFIILVVSELIF